MSLINGGDILEEILNVQAFKKASLKNKAKIVFLFIPILFIYFAIILGRVIFTLPLHLITKMNLFKQNRKSDIRK